MKRTLFLINLCVVSMFRCDAADPQKPAKLDQSEHLSEQLPPSDASSITVDRIFGSHDFDVEKVGQIRWSKLTSDYFTLEANEAGGKRRDLVRNEPATGRKEVVVSARAFVPSGLDAPIEVDSFEFSADESKLLLFTNSKRVWRRNTRGDYWVMDIKSHELKKLGGDATASSLMFAKFSPAGAHVAFVREKNLFVQDLSSFRITALTSDKASTLIHGTSDWVNEEELGIRDGFRWSPDSKSIVFWQFDTSGVGDFHLLDSTVSKNQQITSFPYPKVGETNSATRLGVVSASGGEIRWLNIPGDPREHYLPHVEWTPDGTKLLVQQFNRLQTENRLFFADPKTGEARLVFTETDNAWLENENPVRWLNQGKDLLWLSERSGWRHAYIASLDGHGFVPVTQGQFDVIDIEAVDAEVGWLYFSASPHNATQRYLYRTRLSGGTPERLSPTGQPGWHTYEFSPNTKWVIHTYSTFATPPIVELIDMSDNKVVRVLADNQKLRQKLAELKQPTSEFMKVDIEDGLVLDAWCLRPPQFDPTSPSKYPLLIHVYGEPHGQTVKDMWGGERGMWHRMLAQQGCVVASIDNRGTLVPKGRDWRRSVHRQIGIIAHKEQAAAVRSLLRKWTCIDAARVGVWGWSGGGSMSLNAIFHYPDLYRTAIAVAPNADQLLYDSIYQERYMGLPKDNAQNYREGSPLTHARKLQGNLLVVHGTGDDNGHYQGTEMLINELIAQNKHFTVMPYPNRSHAISEGTNTTRHFWGLLTHYLEENLLAESAGTKLTNPPTTSLPSPPPK
jgi:dipeptidyl-peptidase 4